MLPLPTEVPWATTTHTPFHDIAVLKVDLRCSDAIQIIGIVEKDF